MSILDRLRLLWHEHVTGDDYRASSLRWAAINAARPRVCLCGAPGTVVKHATGQAGSVAPEFWACDEHADVPLTVPWVGGKPLWHQGPDACSYDLVMEYALLAGGGRAAPYTARVDAWLRPGKETP